MNHFYAGFLRPQPQRTNLAHKFAQAFLKTFYPSPPDDLILRFLTLHQFFKQQKNFFVNFITQKNDPLTKLEKLKAALGLHEEDIKFLALLIERNKILFLPEICKYVITLATAARAEKLFLVSTAKELEPTEKNLVFKFLAKQSTSKPLIIFSVNKSLLSGIRIEADCFLYEKSIKSRLKKTLTTLRSIAK